MSLDNIVLDLLSQNRESTYWDFKERHHSTKVDLLHDVLCLSNCDHAGPRYLIFGVVDGTWEVVGVEEPKTQQYFLNFFHDQAKLFAGNMVPEFILHDLTIETKKVQVLEIFDLPYKPYRLIDTFSKGGKKLNPHVFTRVQDRNTPQDRSATQSELDRMYRQRFGLDLTPVERFKLLLINDVYDWKSEEMDVYYCEQHPEYSYRFMDDDIDNNDEEWKRGEIGYSLPDGNIESRVAFFYFQTVLASIRFVSFDGGKKKCVAPTWELYKGGRFYYYDSDSIAHAFQIRTAHERGEDHSKNLRMKSSRDEFSIPVTSKENAGKFSKLNSDSNVFPVVMNDDPEGQNALFYESICAFNNWLNAES